MVDDHFPFLVGLSTLRDCGSAAVAAVDEPPPVQRTGGLWDHAALVVS